jgi:hypothetical protein
LAIKYVEHLRACHPKSQLDTKAIIGLQDWLNFKAVTNELKFFKQLPRGEKMFMRATPLGTYETPDISTFAWMFNY